MAATMGLDEPQLSPTEFMISFLNAQFDDNVRSLSKLQDVNKAVKNRKSSVEARVKKSYILFSNIGSR